MSSRLVSVLWMCSWATCFSIAMVLVKFIEDIPILTIVFIRFLIALILFIPLVKHEAKTNAEKDQDSTGKTHSTKQQKYPLVRSFFEKISNQTRKLGPGFYTSNIGLHTLNALFRLIALFSTYYAYANLPMGLAASIGYTGPIIAIVLAMVLLKEKVSSKKWIAVIVGYGGVLFMVEPSNMEFTIAVLVALFANVNSSTAKIITKKLTETDTPGQVIFYGNLIAIVFSGFYVLSSASFPAVNSWGFLLAIGIFGSLSQFSYIKALQATNVSTVAPFEYLRLLMAIPIGYFIFDEYLSLNDIIGALLIVGCSAVLVLKPFQKQSQ